jgi:hypothetical protein
MSQKSDLWVKLAGNGDTLRVRKVGLRKWESRSQPALWHCFF